MSVNDHGFVEWEEHIICHERGNRVIHFHLKDGSGETVLAVIGTERSVRHMTYVVSDEFMRLAGVEKSVNACMKWRARREVVEWLTSLVSRHRVPYSDISNSPSIDSRQALGSVEVAMTGGCAPQMYFPDHMIARKFRVQNSDIVWSGIAWTCTKQLKHYPAFCRNGTSIAVHSFVFIMAEEGNRYLGYLEDMYEDKKGLKKVKVRWFHHHKEVKGVIPQLVSHPREVFITPHVQVISAECVDGPAIVLTPKHYEKCVADVAPTSSSGIHMCCRQFKNNKIKPFTLPKLRGYSNQTILSSLDGFVDAKQKLMDHELPVVDEEDFAHDDPLWVASKRNRVYKGHQGLETGSSGVRNSCPRNHIMKSHPKFPKLKLRFSRKTKGIKIVKSHCPVSFKKHLKVQYEDVQDADGCGYLEILSFYWALPPRYITQKFDYVTLKEWIPTARVAPPDKLGMRCSGRLTIRPSHPEDVTDSRLEVGAAVDAWWSDGWWEGVITGVDVSGNDTLHVYFPGEDSFLKLQRKNVRISRDWVGNRWVDIKVKPDILSYLSERVSSSLKLSMCSAMAKVSGCVDSTLLEPKVCTTSKVEAVEEHQQELPDLAISDNLMEGMTGGQV
ncbi:hypothetical protein CJ030_MR2G006259 [Morella rubra]|uniref:BAH domain-containing protein n=1 Tax=Morella rubra TaxID=262757 RepID=A0A6A1WBI5_9ROSI|nr:hypothetical protein CJ030_MR2G006259 [Morella rubra]